MSRTRTRKIYGNWTVLSINGDEIFKCLEERAKWYLNRNLAEIVSENTIQLNFEVKKEGNKGDAYYLSSKKNMCVKCGTEDLEELTKHHVVPHMYRKFMPIHIKSRSSFDILPICFEHHDEYERFADALKQELADKYEAPLNAVVLSDEEQAKIKALKSIRVLQNHGDKIPTDKKEELTSSVKQFLGKEEITEEDINALTKDLENISSSKEGKTHAQIVIEKVNDLQEFVEMWRMHFLKHVEPKFMPEHWDPKRSITRD